MMQRRMFNRLTPSTRACWSIKNLDGGDAELRLYDEIGFWEDTTAKAFADALKGITADTIHLHVNSPGGVIGDAMAMYQMLKDHPAKVISHVDGMAASAATYPVLAGDEVIINRGGVMMIHDPLTFVVGNSADLRKEAEALDTFKSAIVNVYAAETGNGKAKVAQMMADETWMNADEAVANGFADRIAGDEEPAANEFDLSVYANVPAALLQAKRPVPKTVRDVEAVLHDLGMPRRMARRLADNAKDLLDGGDPAADAEFRDRIRAYYE